jgi:CheY-like chemotaxis protein
MSVVGQGSTFSIRIPIGSVEAFAPLPELQPTSTSTETASFNEVPIRLDDYRILLAEDGLDNQRLIRLVLTNAGAEVSVAENGQLAVRQALDAVDSKSPFDLILMDMQMPVLDGYDATRQLRVEGYSRPIIALTAHAMSTDGQKCLDAGCDRYETKPIRPEQLVRVVRDFAQAQASK